MYTLKDLKIDLKKDSFKINLSNSWENNIKELREYILNADSIDNFLRHPVIQKTMFVGNCENTDKEYKYIVEHPLWYSNWKNAIKDTNVGNPIFYDKNPDTTGNSIHSVYHLAKYITDMGYDLSDLDCVFEIGGGYGTMAKIFSLIKNINYYIFDIPLFSFIQKWYLDNLNLNMNKIFLLNDINLFKKSMNTNKVSMFISTWAFSEIPIKERETFINQIKKCKYILIAYQCEFDKVDNCSYFKEFTEKLPHHSWRDNLIDHNPNSRYLFGVNFYV